VQAVRKLSSELLTLNNSCKKDTRTTAMNTKQARKSQLFLCWLC